MGRAQMVRLSRQSVTASTAATDTLAEQVSGGVITPSQFRDSFWGEIKEEYIRQYVLARGGRDQMTSVDWGSIGGSLAEQVSYFDRFMNDIANGALTESQIKMRALLRLTFTDVTDAPDSVLRAAMYIRSAREAFYRGRSRALGFDPGSLPYLPCDGGTQCLTNCNCDWEFTAVRDDDGVLLGWDAYWKLGNNPNHCDGCLARAAESAPHRIRF